MSQRLLWVTIIIIGLLTPGYSPVLHGVYGQDAGLAHGAAGSTLRASRSVISAHRTRALLPQRLTKYIV